MILNATDSSDGACRGARMRSSSTEILQTLKFALIVVASVPMMILYPFIQKHFAKGVMIGSIKG